MSSCLISGCHFLPLEADPNGLCILHSQYDEKDHTAFGAALTHKLEHEDYNFRFIVFPYRVSFNEKTFKKIVDFSGAKFKEGVDFYKTVFEDGVIFSEVEFSGKRISKELELPVGQYSIGTNFLYTIFKNKADFSLANFDSNILFSLTEFYCSAEFYGANFRGFMDFSPIKISDYVNFRSAIFSGVLIFRPHPCSDSCKIYFTQARFNGQAIFQSVHPFYEEFIAIEIGPQAKLKFEAGSSLVKAKFAGTDLRLIEFKNVTWHRYWGRDVVYDELAVRKNPNFGEYAQVEALYRQLKTNYEEERDFKRVGDFHYGEMEMHRRGSPWRRWFSWYSLYWALSGYGERPLRAFIFLSGLILGLATLVWWLEPGIAGGWPGLRESLFYLLAQATFQRPDWFKPETNWGEFIRIISPLLIPGQAALLLLALRNRLGRRR